MSLSPGARLGPYDIVSAIGAGGMGEVFRARDTRLNRDVAIKVLPEAFADDPERLARFTREAQTLASLNHPNIAAIHGIEEVPAATGSTGPGSRALVMELVEGEDLSTHIARGAMPIAEALPIARQIAEALETAHEQGIVHRDLKPANIKVRADGRRGASRPQMPTLLRLSTALVVTLVAAAGALAQPTRIDVVTPIAPELAAFGPSAIGVRTLTAVDRNRPDILRTTEGEPTARYDRRFVLEVWYPATLTPGQTPGGTYQTIARDPTIAVTLQGLAVRDAAPASTGGPFPLVILSHGYPGNRYLMSHLGENLASKGFIVVSIDHADSTYDDQQAFGSTLYNRAFDQLFVLDEMARLAAPGSGSFLSGRLDATRTGVVGYSMGGYGVINTIGGGYSEAAVTMRGAPPNRLLHERAASNPAYRAAIDTRVKAAIAIGPWGMQVGMWDAEGLAGIRTPVLFVAGSVDDISGYAKGTRALFEGAVNADRYLLTFVNANHNAAAPHPAPSEALGATGRSVVAYTQHADPVWDTVRMNNILQHFATAYFDRHLKGDEAKQAYFDVIPSGSDAVYAVDREGRQQPSHTYWKGFKRGTAVGLTLEHATPAPAAR